MCTNMDETFRKLTGAIFDNRTRFEIARHLIIIENALAEAGRDGTAAGIRQTLSMLHDDDGGELLVEAHFMELLRRRIDLDDVGLIARLSAAIDGAIAENTVTT